MKKAKRTVSLSLAMLLVLGGLTGMAPHASAAGNEISPDGRNMSGGSSPDSLTTSVIQQEFPEKAGVRDDVHMECEKPPAPVPAPAGRESKRPKITVLAYMDTTLTVSAFTTGELEAALLAENDDNDDFSYVDTLIISSGTLNKADCTFIKENFYNVETLDLSGAHFENNKIPDEAFGETDEWYMDWLTDVILPTSVTAIGDYAFAQTGIETIDISNVTALGDGVFDSCGYLSNIGAFHNSITHLPDAFFYGCGIYNWSTPLTTVDLNNIVSIGDSAFAGSSIETIDISNVTALGSHVFASCENLYDFGTFNAAITHLPDAFFYYCPSLTGTIDLNNIVSIGHSAFALSGIDTVDLRNVTLLDENIFSWSALTDIVGLNAAITEIPPFTFQGTDLTSIDLNNVTSIREYAFNSCDLITIDLSNVTSLGESAFDCCWDLTSVGTLNPLLTEIPENAFYQCSSLLSIDLSNVTTLGAYAFYICEALADVTLNPELTEIPDSAFAFCESFTAIDLSQVTSLGNRAFQGCKSLTDIGTLNPDLTRISDQAFQLTGLTSFDFTNIEFIGDTAFSAVIGYPGNPDYATVAGLTGAIDLGNVTWIGWAAFESCENLTSVTAFDALTHIDDGAFQACTSLDTVDLGNVIYLGAYAFSGCSSLTSVGTLRSDVDAIGPFTFYNCQNLQAIDLTHLTSIGRCAFWSCKALSDTGTAHPLLETVDYAAFEHCEGLTEFDLSSVAEVGDYAFNKCTNLADVGTTMRLEKIGATAFQEAAITAIDLRNVTEFAVIEGNGGGWWASWAFWGCTNLKDIGGLSEQLNVIPTSTFNRTGLESVDLGYVTEIGDWAFYGCPLYDVTWPASATYGHHCFEHCALDFSSYTRSTNPEPFPVGIDNTTKLADIAPNQTPKVFFTLSEQSPLFLAANDPFTVTHSLLTVSGADIAADIIGNAEHDSWLDSAFTLANIAVTRVPAQPIDTSAVGPQDITYTIPPATYANTNQIDLRLEVVDPVTDITVRGTGNATAITTKGGTLQMYADILPGTATVQDVIWSVAPGTGNATISPTGLLTAVKNGTVTVRATAVDTYNALFDEMIITISGQSSSGGGGTTVYTVAFETNGGSKLASLSVSSGAAITKPADPAKSEFVFAGWYTDAALTQAFDFTTKITKNTTLYAKWTDLSSWTNPFTDVRENDWFYDAVRYVYENGLMNGTGDTTFTPQNATTRGMIVTLLYRLEGSPAVGANPFSDVDDGQYYADAVAWAAEKGIVSGYGDDLFGPEDSITREQMAAIFYRYAQYKGYDVTGRADLAAFADAGTISGWATDAVRWANAVGLLQGNGPTLDPAGAAVRAQVAAILHRFVEGVVK